MPANATNANLNNRSKTKQGMGAGHIVAIVFGAIFALLGVGLLVGASALGWANATQRDSDGYFSTSTQRFTTSTYAITSDRIDLNSGAGPADWFVNNDNVATVRIRARTDRSVFIGIGSQADVERYLAGVAHDEVTSVTYGPFDATYRLSPGERVPTSPATQSFWVAQSAGEGTRTLTWTPPQGEWAVVVMNADATPLVNADIALGLRLSFVGRIIGALIIGGAVVLLIGAALIVAGAVRSHRGRDGSNQDSGQDSPAVVTPMSTGPANPNNPGPIPEPRQADLVDTPS